MRDTAQQKFKTDSHLSQGCRKPRIRPECRMQGEIAVLIFTRTPAGCKSYKCIGRSSDLFRFYAFPALRPVAKIVKPFAPHVWGRNSQQRVLSQILTAFPFHSASRPGGCDLETYATANIQIKFNMVFSGAKKIGAYILRHDRKCPVSATPEETKAPLA